MTVVTHLEQHNIWCSSLLTSPGFPQSPSLSSLCLWNTASIPLLKSSIVIICSYSHGAQFLPLECEFFRSRDQVLWIAVHCPAPSKGQYICVKKSIHQSTNQSPKLVLQTSGSIYLTLPKKPPQSTENNIYFVPKCTTCAGHGGDSLPVFHLVAAGAARRPRTGDIWKAAQRHIWSLGWEDSGSRYTVAATGWCQGDGLLHVSAGHLSCTTQEKEYQKEAVSLKKKIKTVLEEL